MLSLNQGNRVDLSRTYWAADNGRYATPETYSDDRFLAWLDTRSQYRERCLFATAPDTWGDGVRTLAESRPLFPRIRELGFPAALVLQPGIEREPIDWSEFDAIFLGGPDDWQYSEEARELVVEARRRDKWAHRGRVNSGSRFRDSAAIGFQSADGTFLRFAPDTNLPRMLRWFERIPASGSLFVETAG